VLLLILLSVQTWQITHFTNRWILFILLVALFVTVVLPRDPNWKLSQTENHPNHLTFGTVYRRLAETASVAPIIANGGGQGVFLKHDLKKHILEGFAGDPDGLRQLTVAFSVGYITVCKVLR
jgi:hypothetical protein